MINADMRFYNYYTYGEADSYGQPQLSEDVKGSVKMAIYDSSKSVQDNVNYLNANYIGLTHDTNINDTYVIQYGNLKLKVLYVNPNGRFKQVFLGVI